MNSKRRIDTTKVSGLASERSLEVLMGLGMVAISVCNDGNVAQLDCTDQVHGGPYYRIEVYRCSQPSGGYGVTLSGSRVEDICGNDHLTGRSNQIFRYIFAVGDAKTPRGYVPVLLEGREVFNPEGTPNGSWEVRIRDLDPSSASYGAVLRATVRPNGDDKFDLHYEIRQPKNVEKVGIFSGLARRINVLNATLVDLGAPIEELGESVATSDIDHAGGSSTEGLSAGASGTGRATLGTLRVHMAMATREVTALTDPVKALVHSPPYSRFLKNLDDYEEFGDYGAKPTHPGTNLIGPNARLASESIFVRQYRSALVLLGRIVSPDMARGAATPRSLLHATTNTRPGVYQIFVGAAVNNIGIYKLGLDKVHSDYGGIPMRIAPGSRLENDATPTADAWKCNETLGKIANIFYLARE